MATRKRTTPARNSNVATIGEQQVIRPQPGPQEAFLSSPADIVIYGGSAGGGKSWGLLMEPLRHVTSNPEFSALFFRRTTPQIKNPGGLWDESLKLYPLAGGVPVQHVLEYKWPDGGKVKFAHLEHETNKLDYQGAQIPCILFDELTHFTITQFFYMLSRNRSMCGVKPYIRATCNPDADSWVLMLIGWWMGEDGFPIMERSGVLRWFIRVHEQLVWGDSKEELEERYGSDCMPKSLTFIPAKLTDNLALMKQDPGYMANLKAMSYVERSRLLDGNWKVRPAAGLYFKRDDVTIIDTLPTDVEQWVRRWDLAATEPSEQNPNPDWTAGVRMGRRSNGKLVIAHVAHERFNSARVRTLMQRIASQDGSTVRIGISQDPGQAGKDQAEQLVAMLAGYSAYVYRETGDKVVRADPFAAQWQAGNVEIVRGKWNEEFFAELEAFPDEGSHDDMVDAASGAFMMCVTAVEGGNVLDYYRQERMAREAAAHKVVQMATFRTNQS